MFGMNIMAWNGGDLEKLEVLQNRVGCLVLGALKWMAAEALRRDLEWSLFSERMVQAVLNYKALITTPEFPKPPSYCPIPLDSSPHARFILAEASEALCPSLNSCNISRRRSSSGHYFCNNLIVNMNMSKRWTMDAVHEQCGENKWNARCVEEDSGMRYLVGVDEECNTAVVDAMKDFLVHAWNKQH
ncbi:hypothetical protein FHG87_024453 [Trinorchestia longiramus]|nr:hypothetical protein FHG87_024453 [Trinorchestia longiramus]